MLQNVGKLGSFVVLEETEAADETKKKNANDEDDDSATADSEDVGPSQSQGGGASIAGAAELPLTQVTKHLTQNKKHAVKLRPVVLNETIVLTQLSLRQNNDDTNNRKRVIVQCGKLGMTIVLTRLHIQLVPTSDAKTALHKLQSVLSATGCTVVDSLPSSLLLQQHLQQTMTPPTVYLVTTKHNSSSRNLAAWCRAVPLVTPAWVEALARQRASPAAPWPDPAHFPPTDDGNDFWRDTRANPLLWSSCTLLSYYPKGSDLVMLAAAAGAKIVPLYDEEGKLLDDDDAIRAVIEQHKPHVFAIADQRRKIGKRVKQLGVPVFNGKQLAHGITEQKLLVAENETTIGYAVAATEEEDPEKRSAAAAAAPAPAKKTPNDSSVADKEQQKGKASMMEEEEKEEPEKSRSTTTREHTEKPSSSKEPSEKSRSKKSVEKQDETRKDAVDDNAAEDVEMPDVAEDNEEGTIQKSASSQKDAQAQEVTKEKQRAPEKRKAAPAADDEEPQPRKSKKSKKRRDRPTTTKRQRKNLLISRRRRPKMTTSERKRSRTSYQHARAIAKSWTLSAAMAG